MNNRRRILTAAALVVVPTVAATACSPNTDRAADASAEATAVDTRSAESSIPTAAAVSDRSQVVGASPLPTVAPPSTSTAPGDRDEPGSSGRPARFEPAASDVVGHPVDGSLTLERCQWRWFDRYDLDVVWSPAGADDPGTAEIAIEFVVAAGDTGAAAAAGTLHLPGPGQHTVTITPSIPPLQPGEPVTAVVPVDGTNCILATVGEIGDAGDASGTALEVAIESPPEAANAHPDSLGAQLAGTRALGLLPLAGTLHRLTADGGHPFDRIFIDPNGVIEFAEVDRTGSCTSLRQTYRVADGAGSVAVVQRRGCIEHAHHAGDRVLRVVDDVWEVLVIGRGRRVDELAERLVGYRVAGVDTPSGGPDPNADDHLAAWLSDHPDHRLGARFPWNGGEIAIVENTAAGGYGRYAEPVEFVPGGVDAGGSSTPCEEYTVYSRDDGVVGYRYLVAADPETVFTTRLADGTEHVSELVEGDNGDWFGFIDLADVERTVVDEFDQVVTMFADTTVTTPSGDPMTCTQR